jgi:hypothetical protein
MSIEKFFKVDNDHQLAKEYFTYKNNYNIVRDHVRNFMDTNEIKTHQYSTNNETFYIVPVEEDLEKFDNMLGKDIGNGLRPFKRNSSIHKAWLKSLKDNNLQILIKPHTSWYFKKFAGGRFKTRLFDINGVVYTSFDYQGNELDCPEGFVEIKASEFWKLVEDYEKQSA